MSLVANLKKPTYFIVALGVAVLLFTLNYHLMSKLPGVQNFMCVEGASLTPGNIGFSIVLSLMTGAMVAGFLVLINQKALKKSLAASSLSGIGAIFGTFTVFCTLCTLPIISLFGISIGLTFFTDFNLTFKIISLLMLGTGLYLLNRQLAQKCQGCVFDLNIKPPR